MQPGERFNTCSHLIGLILALVGLPWMLVRTLPTEDARKIVGALVFSMSCVTLYGASTLFHGLRGRARHLWQRVDHCAIYLLIAGSYTPFALVSLQGVVGWLLLIAAWGLATIGIWQELRSLSTRPPLALYIGMGWIGVVAAAPLVTRVELLGLVWLLIGAMLYTVGTIFYVNRSGYRHAHGLWHLFVFGGTASHYVAISRVVA